MPTPVRKLVSTIRYNARRTRLRCYDTSIDGYRRPIPIDFLSETPIFVFHN